VILRDGQRLDVDAIVLATGFATTEFLSPVTIAGRRGRTLTEAWADGASAYLGMTVPGFPNFFIMYGPNTNLGHNSILFMLECQARYITGCILRATRRGAATLELRPAVLAKYDAQIQADLAQTAWARVEKSWYKDARGRITNNWPHTTLAYWWRTRKVDLDLYDALP
jgi:cation diffusion facilitator CzcD-associated flavoprotein CzcO